MRTDLEKAEALLSDSEYTCVLCKGDSVLTSTERGVKPLIGWLNSKTELNGFCAADRVVGKAAAFLYVLLGVKAVYALLMSEGAIDTLTKHGIECICDQSVKAIRNRTDTDLCPMEKTVLGIEDPEEALEAIKDKIKQMMGS